MAKRNLRRKGLLNPLLPGNSTLLREVKQKLKQNKNLEAMTQAEAMNECCLLACSARLV